MRVKRLFFSLRKHLRNLMIGNLSWQWWLLLLWPVNSPWDGSTSKRSKCMRGGGVYILIYIIWNFACFRKNLAFRCLITFSAPGKDKPLAMSYWGRKRISWKNIQPWVWGIIRRLGWYSGLIFFILLIMCWWWWWWT